MSPTSHVSLSTNDVYAENGLQLVETQLPGGLAELELTATLLSRREVLAHALAITYLALYQRKLPFVAASPTLRTFALRSGDLSDETRRALVSAIAQVRGSLSRLLAEAELSLYGPLAPRAEEDILHSDPAGVLALPYPTAPPIIGRRFLERMFAAEATSRAYES